MGNPRVFQDNLHSYPYQDESDLSVFTEQHFKVTCDY